jgi:alpha-methylacyl-CoA racemase
VALDLKSEEGRQLVKLMAGEADVFVENLREGVMDSLGLGYAELSEENPDLVYLSLRGNTGKQAAHAAHDLNFVAHSGCGEWFLESGEPNYSTQFGDIVGGTLVPLMKLLFQLANPARTGMHLVSHMDENFRTLFLPRAFDYVASEQKAGEDRQNFGLQKQISGNYPHSRYYRCRDGQWMALNAIQKKHWEAFCDVVDRKQWKDRMSDAALVPELDALFSDAPSSYWEALTQTKDICLTRVVPWADHLAHTSARTQFSTDPLTWCGFTPHPKITKAPVLGADTFSIATQMGVDSKTLSEWMSKKLIHGPTKP